MTNKENSYIFGKKIAEKMGKIDQRTQMEASMLSMVFIIIGMILSVVYFMIYLDFKLWFKIVTLINAFFGIVFMLSYLVTTFQQYKSYMLFKDLQDNLLTSKSDIKEVQI